MAPGRGPGFTITRELPAALVAGCTVVIKPAPETPLDAYVLADLIEEAELPPGVVNILPGGREAREHLVSHPGVDKVAVTGSTAAGRRISSSPRKAINRCRRE